LINDILEVAKTNAGKLIMSRETLGFRDLVDDCLPFANARPRSAIWSDLVWD
jgi:hypothetical protein